MSVWSSWLRQRLRRLLRAQQTQQGMPDPFECKGRLEVDQIRVIQLRPGSFQEPAQCDIAITTLEDGHQAGYHALSYAWGDHTVNRQILDINEKGFEVHWNLYEALQYVRGERKTITLWTDLMCINQNDTEERNAQVQQMGRIYAQAKHVLVWLGALEDCEHALTAVSYLAEHPGHSKEDAEERSQKIKTVFSQPWFERL